MTGITNSTFSKYNQSNVKAKTIMKRLYYKQPKARLSSRFNVKFKIIKYLKKHTSYIKI